MSSAGDAQRVEIGDARPPVDLESVDSEGRDEARAATLQTRMFAGLTAFSVIAAVVYGALSHEPAGTTLLLLTGGLTGLCGLYISWRRPIAGEGSHGGSAQDAANVAFEAEAERQWFPHASPWPLAIAVSVVLMGNAMLVGLWLILPASVLLFASVAGFAAQSRNRS